MKRASRVSLALVSLTTVALAAQGCKTAGSAALKDESVPTGEAPAVPAEPTSAAADAAASEFATPPGVPAPFGKGMLGDNFFWEARFNFPPCDHSAEGKKKGVWCKPEDSKPAAEASGVEAELKAWVNNPKIKSVQLAFFSFSATRVIETLCEGAKNRDVKITVFLHKQNLGSTGGQKLATCAPGKLEVVSRGTEFGSGYLQHAKIVLASEFADPKPLHLMPEAEQEAAKSSITRWTSGSANMSAFGTSLHLDNWLFFTAKSDEFVAQENLCFFHALRTMTNEGQSGAADDRLDFAKKNKECLGGIKSPVRKDVTFYPVPHANVTRQPYPQVKKMLDGAKTKVRIAIHRLTTASMYAPIVNAKKRGVDVEVIVDDDTLRVSKCNGGAMIDQGAQDVKANRALRAAGIPVTYLETSGETGQLAHSKYIIVDDKYLFQGAGNFTATSLNISNLGNMEQFYVIDDPGIVATYAKAWDYIRTLSTEMSAHEVGNNVDKKLVEGQMGAEFDPMSCN